jgi:hypothetical protein
MKKTSTGNDRTPPLAKSRIGSLPPREAGRVLFRGGFYEPLSRTWAWCFTVILASCSAAPGRRAPLARSAESRPAPPSGPSASSMGYQCNLVLGVGVTKEWFEAGFEQRVDDSRWEVIVKPHTSLKQWAEPDDPVWSLAPASPCTSHATDPDRVLFTGMEWSYTTAEEWVEQLSRVVNTLRARYPGLRRIDLLTMIRAPRNASCGNAMSTVQPFIDRAVETVSTRFGDLVRPGPKLEVKSCDVFKDGGPHFTAEGRAVVAQMIGDYYAREP